MTAKRRKPVTSLESSPRPWRVAESKGGRLFIYADGQDQPISIVRPRRNLTRSEKADLYLIAEAVNAFTKQFEIKEQP